MSTSTPERPLVHGCVRLIHSRSEIVKLHTAWSVAPFVRPFSCTELEKSKQLNCKLSRSLSTNLLTALLTLHCSCTELVGWGYCGKNTSKPGRAVENRRFVICVVALLKSDQNQRWDDHPHDRVLKIHMHS